MGREHVVSMEIRRQFHGVLFLLPFLLGSQGSDSGQRVCMARLSTRGILLARVCFFKH